MHTLSASSGLIQINRSVFTINQKQATGELILSNGTTQWRLCFFLGQLLYAIEETHRVRRWQRALKRHCPDWIVETRQLPTDELWECQLLSEGMAQSKLSAAQLKAVLYETTQEILFSISFQTVLKEQWLPRHEWEPRIPFYFTLCPTEIKQLLQQSRHLYLQWEEQDLSYLEPHLAPVLKQSAAQLSQCSGDTFLNLTGLFNGRNTLWDIALKMKQPITRVARLLHHFYQQGVVELQAVPDLPLPISFTGKAGTSGKRQPVIACVDDSPLVGRYLKEILTPARYRVLYVQDPIEGVAILAQHTPDLIFLDLVMPKTDGYNVCRFLRKSSAFRKTPVIMLTSWDGLINRTRSKFVGATDFLAKPFESKQVLQLLEKYLPDDSHE